MATPRAARREPPTVALTPHAARRPSDARRALIRVALAAVLANSTWFSATAVNPALRADWGLDAAGAAWLVVAVQLGFIAGSVSVALLNLPDRLEPCRLIAASAVAAAAANAGLLLAGGVAGALPFRFLVGVALAGVYGPGVRLVAGHYRQGRGVATGVVVGALTLGSGSPHLVRGLGDVPWQATIAATSALALAAALVVLPVRPGPGAPASPPLDVGAALRSLRRRSVRLTTLGYLGHMWELYALWAWLPAYILASRPLDRLEAGSIAFASIGVAGLAGSVVAGVVADRVGRPATTSVALLLSASCCLVSPLAFTGPTAVLVVLVCVWGAAVIADSAQFSAAVTEHAEPAYVGSALTLQLALGFAPRSSPSVSSRSSRTWPAGATRSCHLPPDRSPARSRCSGSDARSAQALMRTATVYLATDARCPGVSSDGIASSVASPRA
jgi:predicted MFS family arabinose efflux permease